MTKESQVPYLNIVAFDENSVIMHYANYNTKNKL